MHLLSPKACMSPLLLLPQELISAICAYLPIDGLVALKLAHRIIHSRVHINPQSWSTNRISRCTRLAIRTHLAPPDPAPARKWCILCWNSYPASMFRSSSSPRCPRRSLVQQDSEVEVLELPPRMCCWHIGRLTRLVSNAPNGEDEWVSCFELVCMHCGSVQGWRKCDCDCDSCAFRTVRTYTRFLSKDTKYKSFTLWRSRETRDSVARHKELRGTLYAREIRDDPGVFAPPHSKPGDGLTLIQTYAMGSLWWIYP